MQVFISYSSSNQDTAERLANDLSLYRDDGVVVWFDQWDILPGTPIAEAIANGLRGSEFVLILCSEGALASKWVHDELMQAIHRSKSYGTPKLIPARLDSHPMPDAIAHLGSIDFSDPSEYDNSLTKVVDVLFKGKDRPKPAIPGFRYISNIGEGAFSTVYKAQAVDTGEEKAIKAPKGSKTFTNEIEINSKIKGHPGIVAIERSIPYSGRNFLVMPYAGRSLKWHIEHGYVKRRETEKILTWTEKLLEALDHAHRLGVAHLDIKPSNIMIDDDGHVRLTDFGLARNISQADRLRSSVFRGMFNYMSPEQQLGGRGNEQSDIYSLGAVMFELLTGEKPVGLFKDPREYNPDLPLWLERIVKKSLERRREDRYSTCATMLADLRHSRALRSAITKGEPFTENRTGVHLLWIPEGRFRIGKGRRDARWVQISEFWISETPVTNRQYGAFLDACGHVEPLYWQDPAFNDPNQPVVGVTWHDAMAFCKWLAETTSLDWSLCSEAQWEYAARGTDGRSYPWGNARPSKTRACYNRAPATGRPPPVAIYSRGQGPFGTFDQAGTVWEWCLDVYDEEAYIKWGEAEPLNPVTKNGDMARRVLRGGCFKDPPKLLLSCIRYRQRADYNANRVGFRVAVRS